MTATSTSDDVLRRIGLLAAGVILLTGLLVGVLVGTSSGGSSAYSLLLGTDRITFAYPSGWTLFSQRHVAINISTVACLTNEQVSICPVPGHLEPGHLVVRWFSVGPLGNTTCAGHARALRVAGLAAYVCRFDRSAAGLLTLAKSENLYMVVAARPPNAAQSIAEAIAMFRSVRLRRAST